MIPTFRGWFFLFEVRPVFPGIRRFMSRAGLGIVLAGGLAAAMSGPRARSPEVLRSFPANPTTRDVRAFQILWQSALLDSRSGRFESAAHTLESIEVKDSLTRIYKASFLAETWLAAGRPKLAAQVVDEQLATSRLPVIWLRHLYRLRMDAYDPSLSASARRDFLTTALRAPLDDGMRTVLIFKLMDLDTMALAPRDRLPLVRQLLSIASVSGRLDSVYRQESARVPVDRSAVAGTTWDNQKLMLDFEEKLGRWPQAIDRGETVLARNPAVLPADAVRSLQLKIALWYYKKGAYNESINRYEDWRSRYGDNPEVLQQIARAWRNLSQEGKSQTVYSRLLDQYPTDPRAAEIIWMRTFDAEALGKTEDAIEGYSRVLENFPQHARAPEAMFRIGLTYYKHGDYEAAQKAFRDLRTTQKTGKLVGAARYWEGKSLARRGDAAGARAVWKDLAGAYPFGYYGHQAERELRDAGAWPDSLDWDRRFREQPDAVVRAWMTGVLPGTKEIPSGAGESPYLPVSKLVLLGFDSLAVLTLQNQVSVSFSNPWVLYTAATRCREAGYDYEAYRLGVRLADRIPLEVWPSAPLSVLRLFYPPSYESLVRMEATRAGIAPALVLALIKQESGFEPHAVSRVGARGLMQMMPATGVLQARKEKIGNFDPDSLFIPRVSTRLGIAYLRDVLKKYGGNPYYALAHYNAGPNALERWLPRMDGRAPEEGVEDIGYAETREYVKRVMANYWTYKELWN